MTSHIIITTSITTSFLSQCLIITSTAKPEYYATHTVLVERYAGCFPKNYEVNYSCHVLQLIAN